MLSEDGVWSRVRSVGLDEFLQFDWTLVGEADAFAAASRSWQAIDGTAAQAQLAQIRQVVMDRRRYLDLLGLSEPGKLGAP